ncbi:MAG: hypothetical protein WCE33_12990 [Nitrososphaeraceae archaeon]
MVSRSLLSQLASKPKNKARNVCTLLGDRNGGGAAILLVRKDYTVIPTFLRFLKLRFPEA